jgi:CubicO group peptidase (beta-lactamase class C family)
MTDFSNDAFFDLASLAKCLVTAPLALQYLDLDIDRREQLGFVGELSRAEPLTVRMLLSHQSGLPPWLPFVSGLTVGQAVMLFDKYGAHTLLRAGKVGTSTYSDLNFRSIGELLVMETGKTYQELALVKGLSHTPWTGLPGNPPMPVFVPDGPDRETWEIAAKDGLLSYPARQPYLPHDANSRAGMLGHAGFAATKAQFTACLERWLAEGWPQKQAVKHAVADDGFTQWGLGLLRVMDGQGKYGDLLLQLDAQGLLTPGVTVLETVTTELSEPAPLGAGEAAYGNPTEWWMHTGFTGPVVFVHPGRGIVLGLLMHRRGPEGELIDIDKRRARAYAVMRQLQK